MVAYRWLVAVVVISGGLFGLYGYKNILNEAHASQSMGEPAATIEALYVQKTPYQKTTSVSGVSKSVQLVRVTNELGGKIDTINFKSGDLVTKGQVLLKQDHSEESAKLISARANVEYQKKALERFRTLRRSDRISEDVLDKAIMELHAFESEVAVLEAVIRKKTLRAPFDAKVGIHDLQIGQYLNENSDITTLVGINNYAWIDFYVPQTFDELALGTKVEITTSGTNQKKATAVVESVAPSLTDESRHYMYRARVDTKELVLKHNYLVKVTLPVQALSEEIAIPSLAVSKDQSGDYVFLIQADEQGVQRAVRHKIELGDRVGDRVVVVSGLTEGDYIVGVGAFKLRPGLKLFVSGVPEADLGATL